MCLCKIQTRQIQTARQKLLEVSASASKRTGSSDIYIRQEKDRGQNISQFITPHIARKHTIPIPIPVPVPRASRVLKPPRQLRRSFVVIMSVIGPFVGRRYRCERGDRIADHGRRCGHAAQQCAHRSALGAVLNWVEDRGDVEEQQLGVFDIDINIVCVEGVVVVGDRG